VLYIYIILRGVAGCGRRGAASTHFVWNDSFCTFYVHLWPCRRLVSTHFFCRTTPL